MARARSDWESALEHAAGRFAETIREHGPDSVAFYISGQLLTEDYYAFNKLARALVGTNNIDSNSRLCMSSAVVGYKRSLGADAPPCSYEDLDCADCVLIAGSNMAFAHPVLFRRLEAAKAARPEMRIVVIDPRRTDTCELADLHLALLPGTDVALFHGILHILLWEDWIDRSFIAEHTEGFADLKELVRDYTPAAVADICGIDRADLQRCAEWIGRSPRFLSLWCMGLNQSSAGSAKNSALINLHLATGKIGRAGCGPFSLTGQPNAMGGRETGSLANLLPGHREAADPGHRAEVAHYWGVEQLPTSPVSAPSSCSMRSTTAGSRRSGSPVPTPRNRCRTSARSTRPLPAVPSWWSRKPSPARKPANTPTFASSRILGRKGRLRDQFGTAGQSCPSGRSAPGKHARTGTSSATSRAAWKGTCDPLNPACSPLPTAAACSTNTSCLPPAATSIFPASATHCSTAWGRSNGHFPLARSTAPHGSMQTAASLPPRDARNWSPNPTAPPRKT